MIERMIASYSSKMKFFMTVIYMRKMAAILQKYIVPVYTVENDSNKRSGDDSLSFGNLIKCLNK